MLDINFKFFISRRVQQTFYFFHSIKSLPKITYHKSFLDSVKAVFLFCQERWWKIGKTNIKTKEVR